MTPKGPHQCFLNSGLNSFDAPIPTTLYINGFNKISSDLFNEKDLSTAKPFKPRTSLMLNNQVLRVTAQLGHFAA